MFCRTSSLHRWKLCLCADEDDLVCPASEVRVWPVWWLFPSCQLLHNGPHSHPANDSVQEEKEQSWIHLVGATSCCLELICYMLVVILTSVRPFTHHTCTTIVILCGWMFIIIIYLGTPFDHPHCAWTERADRHPLFTWEQAYNCVWYRSCSLDEWWPPRGQQFLVWLQTRWLHACI